MARPAHLFTGETTPDLYDTRDPDWSTNQPLRRNFMMHHKRITCVADIKATLRAGEYAWPGGYPMFFIMGDGGTLHFDCVKANLREVIEAQRDYDILRSSDWRCEAVEINYEDGDLTCDQCNKRIQSAYAEDETTEEE
jgi:hypothetical protein